MSGTNQQSTRTRSHASMEIVQEMKISRLFPPFPVVNKGSLSCRTFSFNLHLPELGYLWSSYHRCSYCASSDPAFSCNQIMKNALMRPLDFHRVHRWLYHASCIDHAESTSSVKVTIERLPSGWTGLPMLHNTQTLRYFQDGRRKFQAKEEEEENWNRFWAVEAHSP